MTGFEVRFKESSMKFKWYAVSIVCLCLLGCNRADTVICQNKAFEDLCSLAKANNRPFCIVLSDSSQILSREYFAYLQESYKYMTGKAVYNRVDVNFPGNEWYVKWLYPVSIPLTCVFSADGTLIDLIPGAAKETFLYTDLALKNMAATDYHCPNRHQLNKAELILAMNEVLQSKIKLDRNENASPLIDSAIAKIKYPYGLFIKLQNESRLHDSLKMRGTFSDLLSLSDPSALLHYAEEFTAAKKIMDPEYDVSREPFLEVTPAIIEIGNCKYREQKMFYITLKNRGKRSIKILDVETSCSCVTNLGDKKYEIAAFDSIRLSFSFTAEQKGEIERGCYFMSDARNPIVDVKILATVEE
jgi:hypothetical protein